MITVRSSNQRGYAKRAWLTSYHTFSFAEYYDPNYMAYSVLRVINEDWVNPMSGFDTHAHDNMEIITYMVEGEITHRDSMGNHLVLKQGEVQAMSAGTGIQHSEHNASQDMMLHLLQIWIKPNKHNIKPCYDQKDFSMSRGLTLIVSPDGRNSSLTIQQDVLMYKLTLSNDTQQIVLSNMRRYYVQLVSGSVKLNDTELAMGDGASIENETKLIFTTDASVELLLFDLP